MKILHNVAKAQGQGDVPGIIDPENYADHQDVVERANEQVLSQFKPARDDRALLSERWDRYYAVWEGTHEIRYYEGEADLRIRMARKVTDTRVAQTKRQLFPHNPMYYIETEDPTQQQRVQIVRKLIDNDVEQTNLRGEMDLFLTSIFVFGFGIFKTWWETKSVDEVRRRLNEQREQVFQSERVYLYEGPRVETINPARIYIHPITSKNIDEARIIFEDMTVSWSFLKDMEEDGIYMNVDKIKDEDPGTVREGTDQEVKRERDNFLHNKGYHSSAEDDPNTFNLTEAWCKFDLYGDGRRIPCKITAVGPHIIEIRQNPLAFQRAPYVMGRMKDVFDNVYGQGLMQLIEDYQYAIDAMVNQGIDSANFHINHITIINEDAINREQIKVKPRAVWSVRGVARVNDAIRVVRPPDTSHTAFQTASQIIGMMQDIASTPPIMQGKVGQSSSTATESEHLQSNAMSFTDDISSKLSADVLSPLLRMLYMFEQQFRAPDSHAKIAGSLPFPVSIEDLVLDLKLQWHVADEARQQLQIEDFEGGRTAVPRGSGGGQGAGAGGQGQIGALLQQLGQGGR